MKILLSLLLLVAPIPVTANDEAEAEAPPLRVLCWNIHHGVGTDGRLDLPRIAKVILDSRADVVALQEVDNRCSRSGKVDQTAELAKLTGMSGVFGKAMPYGGGEYGQAILSRHPIREAKVHPLPGDKDREPRIAFEALIGVGDRPVRVVSVHLDLAEAPRLEQAAALLKVLENRTTPVILCGDLNDTPDSKTLALFGPPWKQGPTDGPGHTSPAGKPKQKIDYFFVKSIGFRGFVRVLEESIASDHRPLVADFEKLK